MSDETPDVGFEAPKNPQINNQPGPGPYGPYGYQYRQPADDMKVWYESKAMLTSIASFGLYILKYFGIIDWANEMILQVQGFLVTVGLFFARIGNKKLVTRKTFKEAEEQYKSNTDSN